MRALKVLVVVMGVLIVAGVATLAVVMVRRLTPTPDGPPVQAVLNEPPGTRIASANATGDRLAVHLQGGGPDRVTVLDLRTGRVVARAALAP